MSLPVRPLVPLLVAAAGLALTALPTAAPATAASSTGTAVVSRGVAVPAFYAPPATLPTRAGAIVRSEPVKLALRLPGLTGTLPGRATRLMYTSTDTAGKRVAVTGTYLEPTARWHGSGPRPLVVLAPGTMGQGDQCAMSEGMDHAMVVSTKTMSVAYDNMAAYSLLAKGIAVVQTDYLGLGTTDRLHTYVNRLDQGHAVLDAVRAARSLPGASVTKASPVGLYGYSQGGGAVASAVELAPTYAPDVAVRATYSGAPPADLAAVTAAIDGTELAGALGWAINGFAQTDPTLQPLVDKYTNASGKSILKDLSTRCVGDAILTYANKKSSAWTTNGKSLAAIIASEPKLKTFVDGQLIGTKKPVGAVRVATGVNDDLVPHAQSRTLATRWCALGGAVDYVPVSLPKVPSPLLNHLGPMLSDQSAAISWIDGQLAGKAFTSTCPVIATKA